MIKNNRRCLNLIRGSSCNISTAFVANGIPNAILLRVTKSMSILECVLNLKFYSLVVRSRVTLPY